MTLLLFFICCIGYCIFDALRDKAGELFDDKEHELVDNKTKFTFECSIDSPVAATAQQLDSLSENLRHRLTNVLQEKEYWPGLLWTQRGFKIYHDSFSVLTVKVVQASAHEGETLALEDKPYRIQVDVTRQPSAYFWFKIAAATALAAASEFKEGSDPLWRDTLQGILILVLIASFVLWPFIWYYGKTHASRWFPARILVRVRAVGNVGTDGTYPAFP